MGLKVIWHLPPPLCLGIAHGSALAYFASKCWKDGGAGRNGAWELESASPPNKHSLNKVADKGVCPGTGLLYCPVYQI